VTLYRLHEQAFHIRLRAAVERGDQEVEPDLLCARCEASEGWHAYLVALTARHWCEDLPHCAYCRIAIDATPIVTTIAEHLGARRTG
jgi:hypothetical protein